MCNESLLVLWLALQFVCVLCRPNIVLIVCDDLDHVLGSVQHALPRTQQLLGAGADGHGPPLSQPHHPRRAGRGLGASARNWFAHTPVCCPSRAELLTGRYFHNIRVRRPTDAGCMHVNVSTNTSRSPFYNPQAGWYFAPHFARQGYTVGVFGKHLNAENPLDAPDGVDRWLVNGGGDYLDPSFSFASAGTRGTAVKFDNCTMRDGSPRPCYSTSVIGNATLRWLKDHAKSAQPNSTKPFFAYVAVKAPHIQDGPGWPVAIGPSWYSARFPNSTAPRTPNWNFSALDHHWIVRNQPPLTHEQAARSDKLYGTRLRSLLAVDDLVGELVQYLEDTQQLDNTYVVFTSDHGYRFGQFRMPQGKWQVYDNDLRVPFLVRGPGVPAGLTFDGIASIVDIMPTLLDLAGTPQTPSTMDGRSATPLFLRERPAAVIPAKVNATWARTQLLIEYYALGNVVRYQHLEDCQNNTFRALRVWNPTGPRGQRNLKLVEFTDWAHWNFDVVQEVALFDLETDPWEMVNVYNRTSQPLLQRLHKSLAKLYACRASSCS